MAVGTQKGGDTKENIYRNFGCAHPEGYRKALRLMQLADKFSLPVITLIDTAGAYPGIGAEERHIAEAIAVNLREMMLLEVPTVAVVIGEGGSGGALAIGVGDRALKVGGETVMFRHEKRFENPPGLAILISDTMAASEVDARLERCKKLQYERVGLTLRPELVAAKDDSGDAQKFEALVNKANEIKKAYGFIPGFFGDP